MPQTVRFPLEWANNIPGVSGIDDVTFEVVTVGDLIDRSEATQAVVESTGDNTVERIVRVVGAEGQRTRDQIEDATITRDRDSDGITIDIDGVFGPLREDIQAALRTLLGDMEADLTDLQRGQRELLRAVTGERPDTTDPGEGDDEDGGVLPDLPETSIPDRTAEQVRGLLGEGADTVTDAVDQGLPDLSAIGDAAAQAVLAALRELPGFDLLSDPETFIDRQIDRLTDGLVSEDAAAELESAVKDLTRLDEDEETDGTA